MGQPCVFNEMWQDSFAACYCGSTQALPALLKSYVLSIAATISGGLITQMYWCNLPIIPLMRWWPDKLDFLPSVKYLVVVHQTGSILISFHFIRPTKGKDCEMCSSLSLSLSHPILQCLQDLVLFQAFYTGKASLASIAGDLWLRKWQKVQRGMPGPQSGSGL